MGLTPEQDAKRITGGFVFSANQELTIAPSAWQPGAWKAIATGEPYQPKVLFATDSNPLVGHEKPDRYPFQALSGNNLEFIVWCDMQWTPSNQRSFFPLIHQPLSQRLVLSASRHGPRLYANSPSLLSCHPKEWSDSHLGYRYTCHPNELPHRVES